MCQKKGNKEFDSSRNRGQPFDFKVGVGDVTKGWDEAALQMSLGERAIINLPSDLAHGSEGAGPDIPPNSDLVFDVQITRMNGSKLLSDEDMKDFEQRSLSWKDNKLSEHGSRERCAKCLVKEVKTSLHEASQFLRSKTPSVLQTTSVDGTLEAVLCDGQVLQLLDGKTGQQLCSTPLKTEKTVQTPHGSGHLKGVDDGMANVALPYGTGYMPTQSAKINMKETDVTTTHGDGEATSKDAAGMLTVDLPFGTAYIHENDVEGSGSSADISSVSQLRFASKTYELLLKCDDGVHSFDLVTKSLTRCVSDASFDEESKRGEKRDVSFSDALHWAQPVSNEDLPDV